MTSHNSMSQLREITIENLPSTPTPGYWWKLEKSVTGTVPYILSLMQTEEMFFSSPLTHLKDDAIVTTAEYLLRQYTSYNRAKALEEGPLSLVPVKKINQS